MMHEKIQQEVDQNYEAFQSLLPELIQQNPGKWALLHSKAVEAVFDTAMDACIAGEKLYPDKLFSVQEITDHIVDLGWYSHAVSWRNVSPGQRGYPASWHPSGRNVSKREKAETR